MSRFSRTPAKTKRARELRRTMTPAEALLWLQLRSAALGAAFRRQHPVPTLSDFCCPSLKIVIEIDGSQHAAREAYDTARTAYLERQGYVVVRFWNSDVLEGLDSVVDQITWLVRRRKWEQENPEADTDPLPASPFQGEER